jgi:hypothetical protein
MKKVVVERPRWGSRQSSRKFSARLKYVPDHDYEEQPKKAYGFESHVVDRGSKYFEKEFTDVLGPLKRFLRKNVGHPWDKVYSELCRGLDRRKVTGLHIFQHVEHFVETNCRLMQASLIRCVISADIRCAGFTFIRRPACFAKLRMVRAPANASGLRR